MRFRRRPERPRPFLSDAVRVAVEGDLQRRAARILDDARRAGVTPRPAPEPESAEAIRVPSERLDVPRELPS